MQCQGTAIKLTISTKMGSEYLRCVSDHLFSVLVSITSPLTRNEFRHWICDIKAHLKSWVMSQFTEHCVENWDTFLKINEKLEMKCLLAA